MAPSPPPPGGDHADYGEEDLEEEEDEEEEDQNDVIDEDDEDVDVDDDSTSSSNLAAQEILPPPSAGEVTIAVVGVPPVPEPNRHLIEDSSIASTVVVSEKKPLPVPMDESRRLFQRLWTDEDEIELLQGFLEYTTQRGFNNSSSHHHDTTAFYDQIKSKLQLDFNKNQLVEKLRRLKKKYRNVLSKLNSGKDYVFKSPHDQITFEISKKIWSDAATITVGGSGSGGGVEFDDDEGNPSPNLSFKISPTLIDHNVNGGMDMNNNSYSHRLDKKVPRPRKRSRGGMKVEEKQQSTLSDQSPPVTAPTPMNSMPNMIEDTVKSCLSPLFKELLSNAMHGSWGPRGGYGGSALNSMMMPFCLGGGSLNFSGGGDVDEKWRKQQILELEVYSKRLELVQDQIKSQLEDLRSMGN